MVSNRLTDSESIPAIEATHKSIKIMQVVKKESQVTLTDLADRLDYSKSTVHHHLTTLQSAGYVVRGDNGYRIGLLFLDYGIHAQQSNLLYSVAKGKVDELAAEIGENVWVMVEENGFGVFLYHSSETQPVKTYTRDGYRAPLHAFAAGKAILAFMEHGEIDDIVDRRGLPSQTAQTVTEQGALEHELEKIRECGVAFNRQESMAGINAIAAPIMDPSDAPLGSISIAGPANRLRGNYLEADLRELLLGIANEIEVNLHYS